jgi:small-conductance mechanosensitive channel
MLSDLVSQFLNPFLTFIAYLLGGVFIMLVFSALGRLIAWLLWAIAKARRRLRGEPLNEPRSVTINQLTRSLMNAAAAVLAIIFMLSLITTPAVLATTLGLFSAGLGFAARPFISDVMCGIQLLFQDQFAIGEKVEIGDRNVIGVVERVSLTCTLLRGESGELWVVPNGDVRTIRNFTRGSFSPAHIRLTLPTSRLDEGLAVLQEVIANPGPDVLETPEVISEEGQIGETTALMLKVKATHGAAPQVRRRLLTQIHEALAAHQIITRTQSVDLHDQADRQD